MSTIVKAAVQISPVPYSRQGTVEKVVKKIRERWANRASSARLP
jgi:nitrilase